MRNNKISFTQIIIFFAVCVSSLLMMPKEIYAGVVIHGTRIIYPAQKKDVFVRAENKSQEDPALVQVWIDDGKNAEFSTQAGAIPFVISPPLARIEALSSQNFRLYKLPSVLDKINKEVESVFYFYLRDIPPKEKDEDETNSLQVSFTSQLKLFYRPEGLAGEPTQAAKALVWNFSNIGGENSIKLENPTSYHVTFDGVVINHGGVRYSVESSMIAPKSSLKLNFLPVPQDLKNSQIVNDGEVAFQWFNDSGAMIEHKAALKY